MLDYAQGDIDGVDATVVHRAAVDGDALAEEIIELTAYYIGVGLANLVNIFNPELIVLGGGLTNIGDRLLAPAYRVAGERAYEAAFKAVRFSLAELGADVGVQGAAAYAAEQAGFRFVV